MKRSEINAILREAEAFFEEYRFHLPAWSRWSRKEWEDPETRRVHAEVFSQKLGWDVTDFATERFTEVGLVLFNLRNGTPGTGKTYAEKIMRVAVDQETPFHFHWSKTEDIINRNGGELVLELYRATEDEKLSKEHFTVNIDGASVPCRPGEVVRLKPGQSITLTPYLYHRFWAEGKPVMAGEVSMVNDDDRDNRFLEPLGRFPAVDEDEKPVHLLVSDYSTLE